jgi:hypothetical protein
MADDRLLVPMHLSAMVLNPDAQLLTPFAYFQPEYASLAEFEPVGPAPFQYPHEQPPTGVHLHWLLPRPLRHAPDAREGGAGFPLVPNRWAVVRVRTDGGQPRAVKAWIVLADEVAEAGASPYVEADGELAKEVRIGTSVVLDATLTELPDTGTPFLRAVGPGSATFSVYAPGVQNVFGFHDPVEEDAGEDQTFTYHVSGWYSKPEHDPLGAVKWEAQSAAGMQGAWVDDSFGFTAWTGTVEPPKQMLVHAFLYGLAWEPSAKNRELPTYPKEVPQTVTVAAGNTAIDALAELVAQRWGKPLEGRMLQAFQYGLLEEFDQPASAAALDRAIRKHWYDAKPGGTLWTVVARQSGPAGLPTPPPAVLSEEQAAKLDALNLLQRKLDRQSRILDSMRWALAALWWKHQWLQGGHRVTPVIETGWVEAQLAVHLGLEPAAAGGTTPYLTQVEEKAAAVSQLGREVEVAEAALDAALDAKAQKRKAANMPQYFAATDPTIVVTGLGRATVLDSGEALTCRVPSQTVQTGPVAVPALEDPHSLLPSGVQDLHAEAVLLSPPPSSPAPAPAPGTRFPPSPTAMAEWSPPWIPLLLDWRVTFLNAPAYVKAPGRPSSWALDLSTWEFDGTDYRWNGTTEPLQFAEEGSIQMQLEGRTFLTPHLPNTLSAQLHTYVTQHGENDPVLKELLEDLDAQMQTVSEQDILSQNLSGLRQLLVQRDLTPTLAPPSGPVAEALGPDPQRGFPVPFPDAVRSVWDFAPVAGSFLSLDRLKVIDHQGQAVDITYANHNPQPSGEDVNAALGFYPLAADGVRTPMSADPPPPQPPGGEDLSQRMLQLPPRLCQEAQVRFGLRSADGADADVTLQSRATPICGWVVPNHLDRSLAVYDQVGAALGELSMSSRPGKGYVPEWTPDPTNPKAPGTVAAISNSYLAAMLGAICEREDEGAGFADLLLTIDEALWTIEAGEPRTDQDLNVLVGRPLALVRAELSLFLGGLAYTNQDWWSTFAVADPSDPPQPPNQAVPLGAEDGGLGELTWPVRLGDQGLRDDGLIGYFADDPAAVATWKTFAAVSCPAAATSGYVAQSGSADAPYPQLPFLDDATEAPDPAKHEATKLTLLVDPRAAVHAFTGLLPVTALEVPSTYTAPALRTMSYLFRAGPILTPPDEIRMPSPSQRAGRWSWFDRALDGTAPLTPADDKATFSRTPSRAVEGWLKLTPNPEIGENDR